MWVVAVALVNEAGEVLVQQRPTDAAHANLWEFPGGKIEPHETPEMAAVRELEEELSIRLTLGDLRPISFASGFTEKPGSPRPLVILLFACARWQGTPEPLVAKRLAWCDPRDLAHWPMPPLDYPLAAALADMLGK